MKLVIDIPEDVYTRLFDNGIQDNEIAVDDVCEMARAIRRGKPLPKGHGALKDADALKDALDYIDYGQHQYDLTMEAIESAPTIIKADKEGAEE